MTARFQLNANKITLFSNTYPDLATAQAAGAPLVATDYTVVYTTDGTDYFIHASLIQEFQASYPTEAAANAASVFYVNSGYQVSIHETVELTAVLHETHLLSSSSKYRDPNTGLDGAYLTPSDSIAIFVPEQSPSLGITQVDFKLDTVLVNTENVAPWDYAGTDGFGNANRVTFSAGLHVVEAVVTATAGNFTLTANFEVE